MAHRENCFRMTRLLFVIAASAAFSQSTDELQKGQKFLDKISKSWSASLPPEKVAGMYIGRKWVGFSRVAVEKGAGGGFLVKGKYEIEFSGRKNITESTVALDATMCVRKAETVTLDNGKKETKVLTVENGKWKQVKEADGKVSELSGAVTPGTTWGAGLWLMYEIPDDSEFALAVPAAEKGSYKFKKLAENGVEMRQGTELSRWCFDNKWNFVELRAGQIPIKIRIIPEEKIGKNLEEPSRLNDAEKATVEVYKCIKKNDKNALLTCFDLQKYAEEMVSGYKDMSAEDKKATVEQLQGKISESLLNLKNRNNLPEEALIEDFFYDNIQSIVKADSAEVWLPGQTPWKLSRDAAGKWLVVGLGQRK